MRSGTTPARFLTVAFVLMATFLIACSPPPAQQPTLAATAVAQSGGLTTTQPAPATAVPSQTPPSPSPTATLNPTATASPTTTPTPQPTPCTEAGRVEAGSFPSAVAGGNHRFSVYLPPCYALDGLTYPALYLMAGNIHDENKWVELGLAEEADRAIGQGMPPLIVVMPDGGWLANNSSGGPGSYETLILEELIPHIETNYCVWGDPGARAIGGLSRGGYWALEIAFRFPERFVSAGGHSAALLDSFAGPEVNPQQTALSRDLGDLRIYLDIGSEDYLRANTIQLHEEMLAAGVAHDWQLNEGQHVDAYWSAHIPDYLAWYTASWPSERAAYPPCALDGLSPAS